MFVSCHINCVKNAVPRAWPRRHRTTDNTSKMHRCLIFQHLRVLVLNYVLTLAIYISIGCKTYCLNTVNLNNYTRYLRSYVLVAVCFRSSLQYPSGLFPGSWGNHTSTQSYCWNSVHSTNYVRSVCIARCISYSKSILPIWFWYDLIHFFQCTIWIEQLYFVISDKVCEVINYYSFPTYKIQ